MGLNSRSIRPILLILGSGVALHLIAMFSLLLAFGEGMAEFDTGVPTSPLVKPLELLVTVLWFPSLQLPWTLSGWASHGVLLLNTTVWACLGYWAFKAVRRRTTGGSNDQG